MLMRTLFSAVAVAVAIGSAGAANAANLLSNGNFDTSASITTWATVNNGNKPLNFDWEITKGDINILKYGDDDKPADPRVFAAPGSPNAGSGYFIDLSGNEPGAISQTISQTKIDAAPYDTFSLDFAYTNYTSFTPPSGATPASSVINNIAAMVVKIIDVATNDVIESQTFSFTAATSRKTENGAWLLGNLTFSTDLAFTVVFENTAGSPANAGMFLENISLTSVPEPSSIALAGLGVAGLIGRKVRRRRQAV